MRLICDNCGLVNKPGAEKCEKCGQDLVFPEMPKPKKEPSKSKLPPYAYTGALRYSDHAIRRTETGLMLFAIAFFILWIPYVQYIGYILAFVGSILLLLGRSAFSSQHDSFVTLAFILVIASFVISFATAISLVLSIVSILESTATASLAVTRLDSAFNSYLLFLIIIGIVSGISYVLFTYGLQDKYGKIMLLVAYGLSILVALVTYFVSVPIMHNAFQQILTDPNSANSAIASVQGKITLYRLLGAISSVIYGVAYLHARSLIPEWRRKHLALLESSSD